MNDINDQVLSYSNLISQYSDLRAAHEKMKLELEQSKILVAALSKSVNAERETNVSLNNQNEVLNSVTAHFDELKNAYYAFVGCNDALALVLTQQCDDDYSSWNGDYVDEARRNLTRLFLIAIAEIIKSSMADRLKLAAGAQSDFRPASNVDEIPF